MNDAPQSTTALALSQQENSRTLALLEVVLGLTLLFGFIWVVYPSYLEWEYAIWLVMFVGLLATSNKAHSETRETLGLKIDGLVPSFFVLCIFCIITIPTIYFIWKQYFPVSTEVLSDRKHWTDFFTYLLWAFAQQYVSLAFFFRRLNNVSPNHPVFAIVGSAGIFAGAHLPNIPLTLLTFLAGLFWAWTYKRFGNLISIVISHAIIGFFLSKVAMMNLTVGPWTDYFPWPTPDPIVYGIDHVNGLDPDKADGPINVSQRTTAVVQVAGWIIGKERRIKEVVAALHGREYPAKYGFRRADVMEYVKRPDDVRSGFVVEIPVDNEDPGYHLLRLAVLFEDSTWRYHLSDTVWVKIAP